MHSLTFWRRNECVSLREAFGRILVHIGEMRDDVVLFDADVAGGTGAMLFVSAFPGRVFQFGTAEQNMMAAAGGLSDVGIIPVVSTFAAFGLMRAHEQFRTAIAYPARNVKLCCSHLGVDVGPDGPTAQMLEDLAIARSIPNVTVIVPACANEFMKAFPKILEHDGPVYMRIGRSPAPIIFDENHNFHIGKATRLREGNDITIIATGVMVARALDAAKLLAKENIKARIINCSTIKPLDEYELLTAAKETGAIVTAEDHNILGGLGSAVAELISEHYPVPVERIGVPDCFGKSGEPEELAQRFGLTAQDIYRRTKHFFETRRPYALKR